MVKSSRVLTAIFSYNRGPLLWNCITSIERFSPETRIVIFDDGSDDAHTRAVLERVQANGHSVVRNLHASNGQHGCLYDNMNHALDLAAAENFGLLHVMQDDTQFVWENDDLWRDVRRILARFERASQVSVHFWKRLSVDRSSLVEAEACYRTTFGDLGVVNVELLREANFRFGPSEDQALAQSRALGHETYSVAHPAVARVPWPTNVRHGVMRGSEQPPAKEFLIKPLDPQKIRRLTTRDLRERPYGDDYYVPWGWRCWKPYPTGPSVRDWLRSLLAIAVRRRSLVGLVPRRVGED
jgi:glycosyl transferase family 2